MSTINYNILNKIADKMLPKYLWKMKLKTNEFKSASISSNYLLKLRKSSFFTDKEIMKKHAKKISHSIVYDNYSIHFFNLRNRIYTSIQNVSEERKLELYNILVDKCNNSIDSTHCSFVIDVKQTLGAFPFVGDIKLVFTRCELIEL